MNGESLAAFTANSKILTLAVQIPGEQRKVQNNTTNSVNHFINQLFKALRPDNRREHNKATEIILR